MMTFIYNNQTISFFAGFLIVLIILYFIFKKLPVTAKKKVKTQEKNENVTAKKEQKETEKIDAEKVEKPEGFSDEKTQNDNKKSKKEDKKPKIVQIYKREQKTETGKPVAKIDPIYDRNVEFVNTSKTISKFKSFVDEKKEADLNDEKDEFGFVEDVQEDCEFCEDKVKHFDHSKRLSSIMKNDGEDIFSSHISDKYLNINSERHLNLDEKFHKLLYSRMEDMINNSGEKFSIGNRSESLFSSMDGFEQDDFDDEVKVDMKTALISETYFNRKKKK